MREADRSFCSCHMDSTSPPVCVAEGAALDVLLTTVLSGNTASRKASKGPAIIAERRDKRTACCWDFSLLGFEGPIVARSEGHSWAGDRLLRYAITRRRRITRQELELRQDRHGLRPGGSSVALRTMRPTLSGEGGVPGQCGTNPCRWM